MERPSAETDALDASASRRFSGSDVDSLRRAALPARIPNIHVYTLSAWLFTNRSKINQCISYGQSQSSRDAVETFAFSRENEGCIW
eukprot:COSAG05_NODE_354_length_10862_cov_59.954659_1_plen_86_part_00